ncbi:MAG: nodulation protein NfeD [Nitrospira sp.]|nr:nodulation protein NfeD [Nitrospira sp.]
MASNVVQAAPSLVITATYEGIINPVAAEYIHNAIAYAEQEQAHCLVFQLDTPGGLDTSMRSMVKDITGSRIPIVVYVSPTGGRAASAGVFLTLAAHVAAMAPGTNIGAAHPVAMGGGEMDEVMKAKVENDAVAYVHSIAERRGRNIEWAERAVKKSVSATSTQAKELGVIDLVASDLDDLLAQLDGWELALGEHPVTLQTQNTRVRDFPMGWRLETMQAISDPNIAYVLMTIGTVGLIAELYSPGAILPGVVGAISLILAFYSLQTLPVNYAGALLFILGIVMLMLEITVTSYGVLALGGTTAMILGSLFLINRDFPYYQISWSVMLPVFTLAIIVTWLVIQFGVQALRTRTRTGNEGMVGLTGLAKTDLDPQGKIFVQGEIWNAVSSSPVPEGQPIQITHLDGLTAHVKPVESQKESR